MCRVCTTYGTRARRAATRPMTPAFDEWVCTTSGRCAANHFAVQLTARRSFTGLIERTIVGT